MNKTDNDLQALQKPSSWQSLDVQKMVVFGVLAFLAQFIFTQFAGNGGKISDILIAQESMRQELKALSETLRTSQMMIQDTARKDIGFMQKQIDQLHSRIQHLENNAINQKSSDSS